MPALTILLVVKRNHLGIDLMLSALSALSSATHMVSDQLEPYPSKSNMKMYIPHAFQSNLLGSMELEGERVVVGANFSLVSETATVVNSIPIAFTIANIPILVATIVANIWAIFIINRKETSRINRLDILYLHISSPIYLSRLIIWDCLMNMLTMLVVTMAQSSTSIRLIINNNFNWSRPKSVEDEKYQKK